ncbi:GNAT family N-acetyltransferase [Streptomyces sp. NPDC001591]|uniref:GNAT family N-acetyltransferase n=1 Tax=Streptomyces sp. NPDC001591 TaxID=3364589 RepID=UPI00368F06B5
MTDPRIPQITAFLSSFARRRAARTVPVPGGFAALDDEFALSYANNQLVIDAATDPEALPGLADEVLGHLPYRLVSVLDEQTGAACAGPLLRAGYTHCTYLVMLHGGPVPAGGRSGEVDLDALRVPLARRWRDFLPDVGAEVIRQLVERRETGRRGAADVRFIGARTPEGEVAAWADLYLDPASGTAQIEDLVTSELHLGRGYGDAVLAAALRAAADADCATRFLIADAEDWPRHWYERRGFAVIGRSHGFERF